MFLYIMLASNPFLLMRLILMLDIIFVLFILDGYWTFILGHECEAPLGERNLIPPRHLGYYLLPLHYLLSHSFLALPLSLLHFFVIPLLSLRIPILFYFIALIYLCVSIYIYIYIYIYVCMYIVSRLLKKCFLLSSLNGV